MYQALLTRKYLTSKIMPVLAMLAVTLSVGTVLVTWSVMGGFLNTLLRTGRLLIGDVAVFWPNVGFAHYEDLIQRLEADPGVQGAAPLIETFGLVGFDDDQVRFAQIKGVDPKAFGRVTGYAETLWWKPLTEPAPKDHKREDPRLGGEMGYIDQEGAVRTWDFEQLEVDGQTLRETDGRPAAAVGIAMTGWNRRTTGGVYIPQLPQKALANGSVAEVPEFLSHGEIALHVLPLDSTGRPRVEVVTRTVPVANEYFTGMYDIDSQVVIVDLGLLQSMLDMDRAERVDPTSGGVTFDPETGDLIERDFTATRVDPARVTTVLIRGVGDMMTAEDVNALKARVEAVYQEFAADHPGEVPPAERVLIRTWRELNATTIAAVEKETGLVLFVFGMVCFTTVFLVLAIFWSMVSEKTRDIGILRALGAGTPGVAWLWLRYGLVIGAVGSGAGTLGAWAIIANINEIHDWIGATFKLVIWDPAIYSFVRIPTDMEPVKVATVVIAGMATCLLGGVVPAVRAGRMDPVKALRFE